jgi:hypothetical protein
VALHSMESIVSIPLETFEESCVTVDRYMQNVEERSGELSAIAEVEDADFLFGRLAVAGERWRESLERQVAARTLPESLPLVVQLVGVGDLTFACFGGEVFSVMTGELRQAAGGRIYVVGYANGYNGYICPDSVYDEGGYEPDFAFIFGGIPRARRGAHELLRGKTIRMLKEFEEFRRLLTAPTA